MNAKLGALEDLAGVVYKSFMKDMTPKEKAKMKKSIPKDVKEVVQKKNVEKKTEQSFKDEKPKIMGISISKILSTQEVQKPKADGLKRFKKKAKR